MIESTGAVPVAARRSRNPWKWLVLGCGGVLLLGLCAIVATSAGLLGALGNSKSPTSVASGGSTGSTAATSLPTVGQTASKGNWSITLDRVERPSVIGSATTPAQGQYLVVYVTAKNIGRQSYPLNSFDFSITNRATGNTYKAVATGAGQRLDGYSVPVVGETVQPDLSLKIAEPFDLPADATDLVLNVQGVTFRLPTP